jgi:transketolase
VKIRYLRKVRDVSENLYIAHNRALVELAERNEKILSLYVDFPPGEVGEVFTKRHPDRIIDVGIAEGHLVTAAAGLADAGFIPFTHAHNLFTVGRGYNQIRQSVVYDNRNVKIVLCNSGVIWGGIGPSHHAVEDIAALRAIPNLVIISPSDAISSKKATFVAAEYGGPVILRLPSTGDAFPTLYTDDLEFEIGKSICLRDGNDVAILATGILVNDALQVSEELEKEGIQTRVLDIHTIKPLDERAVLAAAKATGAVVTVEDASIIGGLGGAVAELLSEKYPVLVRRVGVMDQFGESGKATEIKECRGLTAPFIKKAVRAIFNSKDKSASRPKGKVSWKKASRR